MNLFTGSALALAAGRCIRSSPESVAQAPLMRAAAFGLFVFAPMGGFLVYEYTAWSWMYLVDPRATAPWVSALAVALYPICGLVGYVLTQRMIRQGQAAWGPAAIGAIGSLVVTVALWDRLAVVGAYAEWELELARPMWKHGQWMWDMFLIGTVIVGSFLILLRANFRDSGVEASDTA